MLKSSSSSHTYDEEIANAVFAKATGDYFVLFQRFGGNFGSPKINLMYQLLMQKMEFGIKNDLLAMMRQVFARYPQVEEAIVFGSRAKGNFRPNSDMDIALKGKNLTQDISYKIQFDLEDLPTLLSFDVLLFDSLTHAGLLGHIDRVGQVFYQKTPEMMAI